MITYARIFNSSGAIEVSYFDDKKRWGRISDGIDTYEDFIKKKNESEKVFFTRLKNHLWEKYFKPNEKRFGRLISD